MPLARLNADDVAEPVIVDDRAGQYEEKELDEETITALKVRISANIAKQETEAEITKKDWVYDSAASHHFCTDRSQFENLRPLKKITELANGDISGSEGIGTVILSLKGGSI